MFADWNAILQAMHNGQFTDSFNRSANSPIPGLTGPRAAPMGPPQQPIPSPTMGNHMMPQFQGPYGQQALQLAGLLGNQGNIQTQQGLLGAPPKGFRIPFYRPVGK
jgi:hypothetical protein